MAKGRAANMPEIPLGNEFSKKASEEKWGRVMPAKSNNSPTAKRVIPSSKRAEILTPRMLSAVNRI